MSTTNTEKETKAVDAANTAETAKAETKAEVKAQPEKKAKKGKKIQNDSVRALVEGAFMLALATVLGYIRIFRFPFGGSIDFALIPIFIYCLRWGPKWSFLCCFANGLLQFFLGGGISISWQSALLDYIVAYTLIALAGFAAGKKLGWLWGTIIGTLGRLVSLVLSGGLVWYMYMPDEFLGMTMTNPWVYSLLYNGIVCLAVMAIDLLVLGLMQASSRLRTQVFAKQY